MIKGGTQQVKTFSTEYTAKNLTKHAGLVNLGKFAEKIGLPGILEKRLTIERGATADYEMSEIVMMVMMGVLAGAKHMSHLMILKADQAIRKLFGWELFPDASTFGKLFKRFNMGHCHELSEAEAEARKRVWSKKWFPRITLDMDSTVIGVTGSQEGAEKGYNPRRKARRVIILRCASLRRQESVCTTGSVPDLRIRPPARWIF